MSYHQDRSAWVGGGHSGGASGGNNHSGRPWSSSSSASFYFGQKRGRSDEMLGLARSRSTESDRSSSASHNQGGPRCAEGGGGGWGRGANRGGADPTLTIARLQQDLETRDEAGEEQPVCMQMDKEIVLRNLRFQNGKALKNLQVEKEKALENLQLENEKAQKEAKATLAVNEKGLARMQEKRDAMRKERDEMREELDAMREELDEMREERDAMREERDAIEEERDTGVSNLDELALLAIGNGAVASAAEGGSVEEEGGKAPSEWQVKEKEREGVTEEPEPLRASNEATAAAGAAVGSPVGASSHKAGRKSLGQRDQEGGEDEEDKVKRLKAELVATEELSSKLSIELRQMNDELVQMKDRLIAMAEEFHDLVPVHVFCEATAADVKIAFEKWEGYTKQAALVQKVNDELDSILRDPRFDPFIRRDGKLAERSRSIKSSSASRGSMARACGRSSC
ncbi:Hypothetical protein NocV09_03300440 [Nannochloropsis oceanica]